MGRSAIPVTTARKPDEDSDVVIDVRGVYKSFDLSHDGNALRGRRAASPVPMTREVLKGIDLQVSKGTVVAVLGSSGAGKSTLLRCVNRLETVDSGTIIVNGEEIGRTPTKNGTRPASAKELAKQRSEVVMVFQHFNLFRNKTALENIVAPLRTVRHIPSAAARETARAQLTRVGLLDHANSYPSSLSGGQQQRVAIARALAMEPAAILFDEPTSSLDAELVGEVLNVIRSIAQAGTTMMIVTHELRFARDIADKIVVMDAGQIVESGNPAQVFGHPQHPKTISLVSTVTGN